jgi:tripartite-type tricarboxylate transporter receptor subunit TctC
MNRTIKVLVAAIAAFAAITASAQTYPSKPLTLVAPFPPGGSTDVLARLIAGRLSTSMGQPVVVENKPGANGSIGASAVARATPDGYTILLMGGSSYTVNSLLYKNLNYDPIASYEYLGMAGGTQLVILTNPTTGINNVADIVAKSKTEALSYGSFGSGSLPHIAGEYLSQKTGAKLLHVPYKGSAPAIVDLMGNQISLSIDTLVASMAHIRSGKIKAVAVLGKERAAQLPDVPTVQEGGISDYQFETWFGVVSPKGTPPEIVERLSREIRDMMADRKFQESLNAAGFDPRYSDAAQFRDQVTRELKLNKQIIDTANIKAD